MAKCARYKKYLIVFFQIILLIVVIILLPVLIDIFFKTGVHIGSKIRFLTNYF